MIETLAPFTVGLLGSLHCVGMCGPLVLACTLHCKKDGIEGRAGASGLSGAVFHNIAFHAGRIITYGVLGAIVAALFHSIEVQKFSMQYRGGFITFSGVLLLVLGLVLLRVVPVPSFFARLLSPGPLGRRTAALVNSRSPASRLGLGLAAGLLPCGLTWAMLITAASTLDSAKGFLTMASFGLGTTPLLFLTGVGASFFSVRTRLLGEKTAALAVTVMGLILLAKGGAILCGLGDHCG